MPYTIQALISNNGNPNLPKLSLQSITLAQGFILVPVNNVLRERFKLIFLPLLEGSSLDLPALSSFGCLVSKEATVAYIEAEFFGGEGMQASMIFENGKILYDALVSKNAINLVLQYLGVDKSSALDEFEALGLGKYRDTEQWIAPPI